MYTFQCVGVGEARPLDVARLKDVRSIVLNEQRSLVLLSNLLKVEIVPKNHSIYQKGRTLAQLMYQKVWQTDKLIDDNDYGIIVFLGREAIANVNVQLKKKDILLNSEKFFHPLHWQNYFSVAESEIAEISGLAICDRLSSLPSRPVLMAMIIGLKMLLDALELKAYTTIQHKFLIRVLTQGLKLPFTINPIMPGRDIPNDNYWTRKEPPRIYYLEGLSNEASAACNSFWDYFEKKNLRIVINSRLAEQISKFSQKTASKDFNFFANS
jgi:hypothetical protein